MCAHQHVYGCFPRQSTRSPARRGRVRAFATLWNRTCFEHLLEAHSTIAAQTRGDTSYDTCPDKSTFGAPGMLCAGRSGSRWLSMGAGRLSSGYRAAVITALPPVHRASTPTTADKCGQVSPELLRPGSREFRPPFESRLLEGTGALPASTPHWHP